MAFTGITATEADIDRRSGVNVSASFTDTMKTQSLLQAESYLNSKAKFNFSDAYLTLNVDIKFIVTMITSSLVAMDAINYDIDALGRGSAALMLNVLNDRINKGLKELEDKNVSKWMSGVT